ncbi:hypothetical protein ACIPPJ_30105 [Streptomyces sp. NPDC086091]|uniref:hypothetical protein n=1 Tax=Streptomyces sp. NPDC086091 TaxID=3365751 RepID=UPI00381BBBB0
MPDEFGRGCGEDGVELGEDAAACGRGDQAALGHHHADRRTEPERLAPATAYGGGGVPLRFLRLGAAVPLRRLPGRGQGLASEADPARLGAHAITAPAVPPSRERAASSGSRSAHGHGRDRLGAGGRLPAQLLQPQSQQVLGHVFSGCVGGLRRGGDGVRAGRVVLEPGAALLCRVRPPGLGVGLLGAAQHRQRVAPVLRQELLDGVEGAVGEHGCRRTHTRSTGARTARRSSGGRGTLPRCCLP